MTEPSPLASPLASPLHLLSPFGYMLFVWGIQKLTPRPNSPSVLWWRRFHNIGLSIASLVMLVGGVAGQVVDPGKSMSFHSFTCDPISTDQITQSIVSYTMTAFLYSKYWEWFDTLFLCLGGRSISALQYTHHMSTALLVAVNMSDIFNPSFFIFGGLNCFVHIPMYWYFAYPKGMLRSYAAWITRIQIAQHVICITTALYANIRQYRYGDCYGGDRYGHELALALYSMYLTYFSLFYIQKYMADKKRT